MSAPLTDAQVAEIEAREKGATPQPLNLTRYDHGGGRLVQNEGNNLQLIADFYDEANREFYVAARDDVPRLIADLRAARAALRLWEEAIAHRDECEACEYPEPDPCPTYDDLSSRAVLARDAALPKGVQ